MKRRRSTRHSQGMAILWPTDLSRLARTALPHRLQLVAAEGELVLLHVCRRLRPSVS